MIKKLIYKIFTFGIIISCVSPFLSANAISKELIIPTSNDLMSGNYDHDTLNKSKSISIFIDQYVGLVNHMHNNQIWSSSLCNFGLSFSMPIVPVENIPFHALVNAFFTAYEKSESLEERNKLLNLGIYLSEEGNVLINKSILTNFLGIEEKSLNKIIKSSRLEKITILKYEPNGFEANNRLHCFDIQGEQQISESSLKDWSVYDIQNSNIKREAMPPFNY